MPTPHRHTLPVRLLRGFLGDRLPDWEGTATVRGLDGPVDILRDACAVPHIYATSERDALWAVGYCQGQDRSFQLDLLKRICNGRLAELIGRSLLPVDRLTRRLGFCRDAAAQLAAMDGEHRTALAAFAQGINDARTDGRTPRAHEFSLLRQQPLPWSAEDVVGIIRFVAFIHAMSWDTQLARLRIVLEDGPAALEALEPHTHPEDPVSVPFGAAFGPSAHRLADELAALEAFIGKQGASNNWVLGGARTRSGRPQLANDPHLDPALPSQFYLAHWETPEFALAGACFVGAPAIAAGHNGHVAWGVTNGKADAARLYLETLSADGTKALCEGHWEGTRVLDEHIRVRGGKSVRERIVLTRRGPIVSPAIENSPAALSFAATWLQPGPLRGFLDAGRAKDFDHFRALFSDWPCAPINLVAADTAGTVGYQLIGHLPAGPRDMGLLPGLPRRDSFATELPFERLPFFRGGENDAFGTANNPPASGASEPLLGLHWTGGYRARRLTQTLAEAREWTVEHSLALQMDWHCPAWDEMRHAVLAVRASSAQTQEALNVLRQWDGALSPESAGACVYEAFLAELNQRITEARAPKTAHLARGDALHRMSPFTNFAMTRTSHTARLLTAQPPGYFQDWNATLNEALSDAMDFLKRRLGRSPARWQWGRLRPLTFTHPLGRGPLGRLFNLGPFPWGGDSATLNAATCNTADLTANPIVVTTLRMVVDVGNWDESRFCLQGGQSGNPASPHYDDHFRHWQKGEPPRLPFTRAAVEAAAQHRLRLTPG